MQVCTLNSMVLFTQTTVLLPCHTSERIPVPSIAILTRKIVAKLLEWWGMESFTIPTALLFQLKERNMACIATEVTSIYVSIKGFRPGSDADTVAGEYRCEIPDEWGNTRDLYITLKWKLPFNITLHYYNNFTLDISGSRLCRINCELKSWTLSFVCHTLFCHNNYV